MKKHFILSLVAALGLASTGFAANNTAASAGVLNSATCVTESKYGKQEQQTIESIKGQYDQLIEDRKVKLKEVTDNLSNPDYMDALSQEAEDELRAEESALNEELMRYENFFIQTMQQAQMRLWQNVYSHINTASSEVAKKKDLNMIVNKDMCFFHGDKLDITEDVIKVMDSNFDKEQKEKAEEVAAETPVETEEAQG